MCYWEAVCCREAYLLSTEGQWLMSQDVEQRPVTKAAAKLEAEMADRDLAKLIVLTPSRKNGLDSKAGSHGQHVGSALTEGLRLFDEVRLLYMLCSCCCRCQR